MKKSLTILLTAGALGFTLPSAESAAISWNNTNTDFNDGAAWGGGNPPGAPDNATFDTAPTNQPGLTSAVTVQGLTFTAVSGYILSSSGPAITLTNTGSGATTTAIIASNTSGTNTISSNLVLGGAAATTATFNQSSGGTLAISGNISSTNSITGISLRTGGGIITLSGNNSYAGTTTLFSSGVILNINSSTAIGAGALVLNANSVIDNTSAGAITLSNNNNINLSNGSLTFTGTRDLSFGSNIVNFNNNRTITTNGGILTIGSLTPDSTSHTFTKAGVGTLVIGQAADLNFQGGTTLSAGVLQIGNNSSLGTSGNVIFTGGTLTYGSGVTADLSSRIKNSTAIIRINTGDNTVNFAGSIDATNTGTGGLIKTGSGTLVLSGASNAYTGSTRVEAGVLRINAAGALTSGSLDLRGGVVGLGFGDLTRGLGTGANQVSLDGDGSGFAAFGANRTVNIGNGTNLAWGASSFFNGSGSTMVLNVAQSDATLIFANNLSLATGSNIRTIQVGNGSAEIDAEMTGVISNSSSLRKTGAGLLHLTNSNTYTGKTHFDEGILRAAVAGSLGNGGDLVFNGGTLQYGTNNTTDYSARIKDSSGAVRIDTRSESVVYNSSINSTNTAGLVKLGSGSLTLAVDNTYTGTTLVQAGTLIVNGNIASSPFTVGDTSTLRGNGTTGQVNVLAGGTLAAGSSSTGTLAVGDLSLAGVLSIRLDGILAGTGYDQIQVSGSVDLLAGNSLDLSVGFIPTAGQQFFILLNDGTDPLMGQLNGLSQGSVFSSAGYFWQISYLGNASTNAFLGGNDLVLLSLQAIPEPATRGLLLLVGGLLLVVRHFRSGTQRGNRSELRRA